MNSTKDSSEFFASIRVYIEDTDAGGVVYYVNYLKFMERARTDFLRSLGFPKAALLNDELNIVVVSASIDYKRSAVLDDELHVTANIVDLGRTYMVFEQSVYREGGGERRELLASGRIKVACINHAKGRPAAFPSHMSETIKQYLGDVN